MTDCRGMNERKGGRERGRKREEEGGRERGREEGKRKRQNVHVHVDYGERLIKASHLTHTRS